MIILPNENEFESPVKTSGNPCVYFSDFSDFFYYNSFSYFFVICRKLIEKAQKSYLPYLQECLAVQLSVMSL